MEGISSVRLSLKHGTPTDDELEILGVKIGEKWTKLGRRLGVRDQLQEINQTHDQLSEKGYHMLKRWQEKNGSAATYQALCDALQHELVQRQDLAEKFCYINAPPKITEGSNIGKKRTAPCSSSVNVKKTKSESSQQTPGLAPDPDPSLKAKYGNNLLHIASEGGNLAIIETMLSRGLDINLKDSDGNTPLMIAAFTGKMEAVNYLLEKGADPSLKGQYGRNLLHKASNGGNVAIIETMLSRGLDINSKDSNGDTALMIAAFTGKMEAVNYLLDKGADPSLKGLHGRNLLHNASNGGNVAIIETMLSRGLDVNLKDSDGQTPLMIALARGNAEAVNYLLSRGAC